MAARAQERTSLSRVLPRAFVVSLLSVSLAVTGHLLGHGTAPDLPTFLVLVVAGLVVGTVLAHGSSPARVVVGLGAVQALVHVVATWSAAAPVDARLLGVGHQHGGAVPMPSMAMSHGSSSHMLAWHVLAVPVTAALLVAVDRIVAVLRELARRTAPVSVVVVPALRRPTLQASAVFLRAVPRQVHLDVLRSNAPPLAA
jgi:hypothetical protein